MKVKKRTRFDVLLRTMLVHNQCWLGHYNRASAYGHLYNTKISFWSRYIIFHAIFCSITVATKNYYNLFYKLVIDKAKWVKKEIHKTKPV